MSEKTIDPLIEALDPFIEALFGENNGDRWGAAEASGRIKVEKTVNPLINAFIDCDDFTRLAAARVLSRIKPEKTIESLINTFYDWNRFVNVEAARALSEICTKSDKAQLQVLLASKINLQQISLLRTWRALKPKNNQNPDFSRKLEF
ncbi:MULTISPECIES: HEAT repeat domain-containing protein [unclassified Methanosarcina]|uniref:HEAT repeat domain-containing protein n=1 Tax=unclassified Methanosarcina TaxID=2644672 RepID=UPI000615A29D|nr:MULTISPECIES: HEAT repeat domain-containing protein [unclassified Methanosarcina]AKB19434.1 hypothetical protein MSWHS_2571 [Methanosarcina sp. WWM596]AKB22744.1 hypothetical protein MSWH1_2473 [Methanosarcina sp. WH1]